MPGRRPHSSRAAASRQGLRRLVEARRPSSPLAADFLELADLFPAGRDVPGGVSGVEDAVAARDDALVIDARVLGEDHGQIDLAEQVVGEVGALVGAAVEFDLLDVGIRVAELGALLASSRITSRAGDSRMSTRPTCRPRPGSGSCAAVHRDAIPIEEIVDAVGDVAGHLAVDLGREIDEARLEVQGAHLPGQVGGIDRNAMAAEARTRGGTS